MTGTEHRDAVYHEMHRRTNNVRKEKVGKDTQTHHTLLCTGAMADNKQEAQVDTKNVQGLLKAAGAKVNAISDAEAKARGVANWRIVKTNFDHEHDMTEKLKAGRAKIDGYRAGPRNGRITEGERKREEDGQTRGDDGKMVS